MPTDAIPYKNIHYYTSLTTKEERQQQSTVDDKRGLWGGIERCCKKVTEDVETFEDFAKGIHCDK